MFRFSSRLSTIFTASRYYPNGRLSGSMNISGPPACANMGVSPSVVPNLEVQSRKTVKTTTSQRSAHGGRATASDKHRRRGSYTSGPHISVLKHSWRYISAFSKLSNSPSTQHPQPPGPILRTKNRQIFRLLWVIILFLFVLYSAIFSELFSSNNTNQPQ